MPAFAGWNIPIRGNRHALAWLHEKAADIRVNEESLKRLHVMARGEIWDAGKYKEKDGDIIERYADGGERVRFKPVPASQTPAHVGNLIETG